MERTHDFGRRIAAQTGKKTTTKRSTHEFGRRRLLDHTLRLLEQLLTQRTTERGNCDEGEGGNRGRREEWRGCGEKIIGGRGQKIREEKIVGGVGRA